MKYREEGGAGRFHTGKYFVAVPGRAWMFPKVKVPPIDKPQDWPVMGVQAGGVTFAHEMLHGAFDAFGMPPTTAWVYEHIVDAGTALINKETYRGGKNQPAWAARILLGELTKDRVGCDPILADAKSSPGVQEALEARKEFLDLVDIYMRSFTTTR